MRLRIKMYMEGRFPGSPDVDYYEVSEEQWDKIRNIVYPDCETQPF